MAVTGIFFAPRHALALSDPLPPDVSGSAKPVAGDSLVGFDALKDIDAPVWGETCPRGGKTWNSGDAARGAFVGVVGNESTCEIGERHAHGQLLGRCAAGGRDLNAGMVLAGMVVLAGITVADGGSNREEADAKSHGRGLWAGEFKAPRQWRAEHNSPDGR